MKIVADNKIPMLFQLLGKHFDLTMLPLEEINAQALKEVDILIVRSVLRVNQELLQNTRVSVVATVTSGTDHIDKDYLRKHNITLFSAPGSNAQGVVDYILWHVAYLTKHGYISHLPGNEAGIIGLGHVGTKVKQLLETLGFNVICYDPPKAVLSNSAYFEKDLNKIAEQDLICVHAELTYSTEFNPISYPSYHLLSTEWLQQVKKDAVIINAARGAIIDTAALLKENYPFNFCLDVFENEPNINETLVNNALTTTPHIAGHTIESFYRASTMIANAIKKHTGIAEPSFTKDLWNSENILPPILAQNCQHWYEVILMLYNFQSHTLNSSLTSANFYSMRAGHRFRHDFAAIPIVISKTLNASDQALLKNLGLNIINFQENNHAE